MPLKLKKIFVDHDLRLADWCRAVIQEGGRPLSKTAGSRISNWDDWPSITPRASIEAQTRAWLVQSGVPQEVADSAFEQDEEATADGEKPPRGHPAWPQPEEAPRQKRRKTSPPKIEEADEDEDEPYLEPQMLNPQAKKHFRLFRDPFNTEPACFEDVFRGPDQRYASECMWEAVRNKRLFALVGESGSGKTTLVDDLKERIAAEDEPVRLMIPETAEKERINDRLVLEAICRDIDPHCRTNCGIEILTRMAKDLLQDRAEAGEHCVLLFEEAHDLSTKLLRHLKRFHELKVQRKRLMSIVLVGQPELLDKIGVRAGRDVREVSNRLEICQLLPLEAELEAYVAHKLARVSAPPMDAIFRPDALDAVRQLKETLRRGTKEVVAPMTYPLRVNNLLVAALNLAAEMGAERVDGSIVRRCM